MDDRLRLSEFKLLFALDALMKERNVTRAARSLGISQPTLSEELAQLRKLFGDQLLVPTTRGLAPTPRALEIEASLRRTMQELESIVRQQSSFDPAISERTFVVAMTDYGHHAIVAPLMRVVRQQAPHVKVVFIPFVAGIKLAELESGNIDLVVAMRQFLPEALKSSVILADRHVVIQRRDSSRRPEPPSLEAYCAMDHVIVTLEEPYLRTAIDQQLDRMAMRRNVVSSVPAYSAIGALVGNTDMVATILQRVAQSLGTSFLVHPLPFPTPEFLYAAGWHPRHHDDPGHSWLRKTLAHVMAQPPEPPGAGDD
ncbi:LysR family transcriptional regulator [Hydrogenophaga sp. BPS33]|uniref:LysR family transcriptional regulator n=1 Tax=Hydrogenophaga sp. BPS33 TaxID=2651974 RepID=UPI00131F7910|nr:LysR family transcriptional regulator [Hydrogenophaga sp. BPS33]QHE84770.1 LysR family transcriptional regulator [Hydrogenophaga sp. BPS33]